MRDYTKKVISLVVGGYYFPTRPIAEYCAVQSEKKMWQKNCQKN